MPSVHVKLKPGMLACACNPKAGKVTLVDSWCSLPSLAKLMSSDQWGSPVSKEADGIPGDGHCFGLTFDLHLHTCLYSHMHVGNDNEELYTMSPGSEESRSYSMLTAALELLCLDH